MSSHPTPGFLIPLAGLFMLILLVTVTAAAPITITLDVNGNGLWDGPSTDKAFPFGITGDIPFFGDWNGDGKDNIGIFRPGSGLWSLDSNGNTAWDVSDKSVSWGLPGDTPVVGDWNGDGKDDIGILRPGSDTSSITVTTPNGGESWQRGTTHTITWSYTGSPGSSVKLVLVKAGTEVGTIIASTPIGSGGSGSYPWEISSGAGFSTGSDFRVSVQSISQPAI